MIKRLRRIRVSSRQMLMIVVASAASTAVIVLQLGSSAGVPATTLAALHQSVVVHRTAGAAVSAPPAAAPASPAASAAAGPAFVASVPAASVPSSNATATTVGPGANGASADGGASTDTGATSDTAAPSTTNASAESSTPAYPVKHVFVIALSTPDYRAAFGAGSAARYLNHYLRRRGTLLRGYHSLGQTQLPDYLAMISGQAANPDTTAGCPTYAEFPAGTGAQPDGQVRGSGCVYPNTTLTIGDQLTATGKTWRAYVEGMDSTCVHPDSGAADDAPPTGAGADYATRHNPFIYFHSLLDLGDCGSDDVPLERLSADLASVPTTPTLAYVAPGQCEDAAAVCPGGGLAGLAAEDAFLRRWVPKIVGSPAYQRNGLLMIVFAPAGARVPAAAAGVPAAPGVAAAPGAAAAPAQAPATAQTSGAGAAAPTSAKPVRTGVLVLSRYATPGRTLAGAYNPYSVLRTIEDVLGHTPLAGARSARSFAAAVLSRT